MLFFRICFAYCDAAIFSYMYIILYLGEFGDVYKGILKTEDRGNIEVAAKTLKVKLLNSFYIHKCKT